MTAVRAHAAHVLFGATHVEFGKITWKMPVRASIVVMLLVAWAGWMGEPQAAIPLAIGGLFAAVADVGEPVGYRWRTMLWTTSWLMVAMFVGVLVSEHIVLVLLVTPLACLVFGLGGALGARAGLASLLSLVVFTVYAGTPDLARDATPDALLVGLGGVIQTAVTVVPTLLRHPTRARRPDHDQFLLRRLPEHLNWSDPFMRHAVRLAVAVTFATILAARVDYPHSYWIPMTVVWMAKPDRDGTSCRVLARILGTLVGVVVVTALVEGLSLQETGLILVVGLGSVIALAFIWANYAVAVVGVTVFVIALFAYDGGPVGSSVGLRIVDTVVAGIITIAASFLWPVKPTSDNCVVPHVTPVPAAIAGDQAGDS